MTVTDIVPETTFPLGLLVVSEAVMPATPQFVFGVTLPVLDTTATSVTLDDHVTWSVMFLVAGGWR